MKQQTIIYHKNLTAYNRVINDEYGQEVLVGLGGQFSHTPPLRESNQQHRSKLHVQTPPLASGSIVSIGSGLSGILLPSILAYSLIRS